MATTVTTPAVTTPAALVDGTTASELDAVSKQLDEVGNDLDSARADATHGDD